MDEIVEKVARKIYEAEVETDPNTFHLFKPSDTEPWNGFPEHWKDNYMRAARAIIAAFEEAGWCVVPVEPTEEMLLAMDDGMFDTDELSNAYRTMLDAAPKLKR